MLHAENEYTYERITEIKDFIKSKCDIDPKVGIICGTGLGSIGELITDAFILDYKNIPYFPISTVEGHKGRLILGYIKTVPVICMQGRFHYYEGYSLSKCVMPVRLMKLLGVTHLIASNAAGGLNQDFKIGDIMLQKDHVNVMGFSGNGPLVGLNDLRFGPRFFSMVNAYDVDLLESAKKIAEELGLKNIKEGVYTCVGGPTYETVAEVRALRSMGIDAAGMSTVHEVTTARHCGMRCFAFSLITNICPIDYSTAVESEIHSNDVIEVAMSKDKDLKLFVERIVQFIGKNDLNSVK
ncbi:unnamed protein product [Psylliodes chrysocephalus]|uniref:Purine nucleoside phosphorylase n=1 Tax=Psylliodes chrysocephalus TaxID=3402493 RepID=A0A9P0G504_9CUCU|nr:unnamed protein product [Psylliodes chrysocephala]